MTPENLVFWNGFRRELTKVAFPEAMLQAAERALAAGGRAAGGVAHGVGRAGAEALSGIPTRMNMSSLDRSRRHLQSQLERLERMALEARPPGKGIFQRSDAHQRALDEWTRAQEAIGQRRQMLQQQLPMFEAEADRLADHLHKLKTAPWTTDLRNNPQVQVALRQRFGR
jgi:hypothetical protein